MIATLSMQKPTCKEGKKKLSASCSCRSVNRTAPSHFGGFKPLAWSLGFNSCSMMHKGACSESSLRDFGVHVDVVATALTSSKLHCKHKHRL